MNVAWFAALVALAARDPIAVSQASAPPPFQTTIVREWLVIASLEVAGRRPFRPDTVFARYLLDRAAASPKVEDALTGELRVEKRWQTLRAGDDGRVEGEIGWAYASIDSEVERVVFARLDGAARLFVNGAGFTGDSYGYGFGGVPIPLQKGGNDLYVTGVRGAFSLELSAPAGPIVTATWDVTRPDAIAGTKAGEIVGPLGIVLFNATDAPLSPSLRVGHGPMTWTRAPLFDLVHGLPVFTGLEWIPSYGDPGPFAAREWSGTVPPLAPRQARLMIEPRSDVAAQVGKLDTVMLLSGGDAIESQIPLSIDVRSPAEARRVTFDSSIDASTQYFALLPAARPGNKSPKIVLSLHGASVDALAQARSYSAKDDFWIVCPTNRRPFGFDWQDWGRRDAGQALIRVESLFESLRLWRGSDAPTTYLTGHSMGGHGTWHLAANDPWSYTAIAPSAGWCSFDTYGTRPAGALRDLWHGADGSSRTLDLIGNLARIPAYVLHGTADDNVPVGEARAMVAALEAAGAKPAVHYQEGAGHWWDGDAAPGADCVDWPEIFALFQKTPPRTSSADVDFTVADPGVSPRFDWLWIMQPIEYGKPCRWRSHLGDAGETLRVSTENVRRGLILDAVPGWKGSKLVIDDTTLELSSVVRVYLLRDGAGWRVDEPPADEKSPARSGPFKRAFDHDFVLVYGTIGTPAECRELRERALSDLETWWYRANGTPELVSDVDYSRSRQGFVGRNVILYGNADTNAAWKSVLPDACPIRAARGSLKLGEREWKGDDLSAVFVTPMRPAPGQEPNRSTALVGVFADSGARGTRLGYTLSPFASGVGYPDYALFSSDVLSLGDAGILAAGWFDHAWKLDPRQYVREDKR